MRQIGERNNSSSREGGREVLLNHGGVGGVQLSFKKFSSNRSAKCSLTPADGVNVPTLRTNPRTT